MDVAEVERARAELDSLPPGVRCTVRLDPATGCLRWTGSKHGSGYGRIWDGQRMVSVHRYVWSALNGPVPDGLMVMHSCDVRDCARPSHLSLGTAAENLRQMTERGRRRNVPAEENRAKTTCPRGHPYDGENLKVTARGHRLCRTCLKERDRARRRAARLAATVA